MFEGAVLWKKARYLQAFCQVWTCWLYEIGEETKQA